MGGPRDEDGEAEGQDEPKPSGRYVVRPKSNPVRVPNSVRVKGTPAPGRPSGKNPSGKNRAESLPATVRVSPTMPGVPRSTTPNPATQRSPSEQAQGAPVHRSPAAGDVVGDTYRVVRAIGEGGMGSVFEATHKRLNHAVALKTIHPSVGGSAEIRRAFFREARFAASMRHPQLIAVLDYGEDPSFGPYLVMEMLEGELVSNIVDRGEQGFSEEEILEIGVQLCDALAYVHGQGLAHGDIKAPNLMLVHDEHVGVRRLKLIDFGLARTRTQKHDGKVTGTPEYLAPELIQGQPLSAKSDLYAVGALLFELICLQPPFHGQIPEVLRAQVYESPPRPSDVGGDVSIALENLVLRLLAKNPDLRPESANALRVELSVLRSKSGEKHSFDEERDRLCCAAFDSTSVARAVISRDGHISAANRSMRRLSSPTGAPIVGSPVAETPWARAWPELVAELPNAAAGQTLSRRLQLPFGAGSLEFFVLLERSDDGDVQLLAIPATSFS